MVSFVADKSNDSTRLDIVLSKHSRISSRSKAQKIIKAGNVTVNNSCQDINPSLVIKKGDIISFTPSTPSLSTIIPIEYELDIVFEDHYLIVVNKKRGVVVHPAVGHSSDTLVNYLLYHTNLSGIDSSRPGIVHRIDKDTSGLLVVAKDNHTHENLADQFFNHSIERKYSALVWGIPETLSGTIDRPIGRHPVKRKKFAILSSGKPAKTHWKVIETFNHLSMLECRLETGRTHQIRVHLSSIGHALLGDPVYGRFRNFANNFPEHVKSVLKSYTGQALHAQTLGFQHPHSGQMLRFDAPLPDDMKSVLLILQKDKGLVK